MLRDNSAAHVVLLAFISATLLTSIQAQSGCSVANPSACTSCTSCVFSRDQQAQAVWYSDQQYCGLGAGFCVATDAEIPCFSPRGKRNYRLPLGYGCVLECSPMYGELWSSPLPYRVCPSNYVTDVPQCTSQTLGECVNSVQCIRVGGNWYNSDRSASNNETKPGQCFPSSATAPCDSWRISNSSTVKTHSCATLKLCQSCVEAQGIWFSPNFKVTNATSDGENIGYCRSSRSSQDTCNKDWTFRESNKGFPSCTSSIGLLDNSDRRGCLPDAPPSPVPMSTPTILSSSSSLVVGLRIAVAAFLALM